MDDDIAEIAASGNLVAVAVTIHDFATNTQWRWNGDRWFHAASTIKVAVLLAVAAAVDEGRLQLESRLAVRNRILSVADGEPFRVAAARDAGAQVYAHIGRTLTIGELARHMIVTSSNLATNLILDLVGVDYA